MRRPDRGLQQTIRRFWFETRKKQLFKQESPSVVGRKSFFCRGEALANLRKMGNPSEREVRGVVVIRNYR